MRARRRIWSAILVWIVILVLLAIGGALVYRHIVGCDSAADRAAVTICTAYDAALPILEYADRVVPFLDAHERAITALFLVVLSLSTLLMWSATRKVARAGAHAAQVADHALTRLQRPFVFPRDFAATGIVTNPSGPA